MDDKSVIRYGVDGPGWTVSPSDDPKVTLTLTDPVTGEAPYVKKIIISPHVNVEKVKLTMTKELDNGNQIQIEDTVALDESRRNSPSTSCETDVCEDQSQDIHRFFTEHGD